MKTKHEIIIEAIMNRSLITEDFKNILPKVLKSISIAEEIINNKDYYYCDYAKSVLYVADMCEPFNHGGELIAKSMCYKCALTSQWFLSSEFEPVVIHPTDRVTSSYHTKARLTEDQDTLMVKNSKLVYLEGNVWLADYLHMWESDDLYHREREPDYNFPYHGSNPANFSSSLNPAIGFEVEKVDQDAYESERAQLLQNRVGWGKENDSSLSSDGGYELVSPIYDLTKPISYFKSEFEKIADLLDADYDSDCGGHINYSHPLYSNDELLDRIKGYLPLIYALYEHRLNSRWSQAKGSNDLKRDRERYQSVNIKSNCLEFRIFPAVTSKENLLWRVELFKIINDNMTSNPEDVIEYIGNEKHPLHKHLIKIFSFQKLLGKISRIVHFSKTMEGFYPSDKKVNKSINKLNK